jgi:uncharacterized protein (DUF362 family)
VNRRRFLLASAAAFATPLAARLAWDHWQRPHPWEPEAYRKPARSRVALLRAADYGDEARLVDVVTRGVGLFDLPVRGKRVVLKPNLVEYDPEGVINTHPALIAATVDVFRSLGAAEVIVAEGPGHRRDNEYLLVASGLETVLRDYRVPYVDLNHDRTRSVALATHFTRFGRLELPRTVLDADLFVSMPKLKTHHWAGVTLSMKNLFGIVPGAIYGWPKNALHWAGLQDSIVDLNAAVGPRRFAIVDAIVGMEGNGPIQGRPRRVGVVAFGEDPVAVDATGARLMGMDPLRIAHIERAGRFLGNAEIGAIEQIGEPLAPLRQDFAVLEQFQTLRGDEG